MTPFRNDSMCPINKIVPLRQRMVDGDVNIMSTDPHGLYDYFTLYTPAGKPLARSTGHEPDEDIVLNYRGLNFICSPGYEDAVIVLEWFSLINWANDCLEDNEVIVELLSDMVEPEELLTAMAEQEEEDERYLCGG